MDQTLSALGGILLQALPTFFLVLLLYAYLRKAFFRPLGEVLDQRRQATEGARKRAEELLQKAEAKTAEYEAALAAARAEIYRDRDAERQRALEAQAARVREAREQAGATLRQAREQIAQAAAAAKQSLAAQAEALSDQITRVVLAQ